MKTAETKKIYQAKEISTATFNKNKVEDILPAKR